MVVIGDDKVTGSVLSLARICELFSLPENIALLVLNGTKSMNSLYTLQPEIVERLRSAQNGIYPVKLGPFVLQGYKGFYDITEMAAGTPGLSEKLKGLPYVKQRDSKLLVEPGQVGGIAVLYDSTIKTQLPPGPAEEPPAGIPPSLVEEVESLEGIIGIQEDEDILKDKRKILFDRGEGLEKNLEPMVGKEIG